MSKITNYANFLNEEFYKKISKKENESQSSKIDSCVAKILDFLNQKAIYTWDNFLYSKKADKFIINKMIDDSTKNMREFEELRFKLKLELSSRQQLRDYLVELQSNEEYEKCALIVKKLSN